MKRLGSNLLIGVLPAILGLTATAAQAELTRAADIIYSDASLKPDRARTVDPARWDRVVGGGNAIEKEMRRAAKRFDREWGDLPQAKVDTGKVVRPFQSDARISAIRARLGLPESDEFDDELAERIEEYRGAHGLAVSNRIDNELIGALNRGHDHYRNVITLNIARLAALPEDLGDRFVLVDAAEQKLYMYNNGRVERTMRVIVGKESDPTPMMAGVLRYSILNPYWNVPVDLTRRNIAPKVLKEGKAYLDRAGFEALSDWTPEARVLSYKEVDWKAVERGDIELRVRQKPGAGNGMGEIKFMFPNELGIYLHDTPSRDLFDKDDRSFSAGCVRLEKPWELAEWLYGERPDTKKAKPEQIVALSTSRYPSTSPI